MKQRIESLTIEPTATIRKALQAVDQGGLGLALIVEPSTRRFVGIVTDGDLRRAILAGKGLESLLDGVPRRTPTVATTAMTSAEITALFSTEVRAIPVLDEEQRVVDLALFDKRAHLPVSGPSFDEKELQYVTDCILGGWVSSAGKYVTRLEEMFAEFCGTKYAVSASNGTTALHLALLALGVGPGDEVIVPTLTFIATANAVRHAGATPVFVDSEPLTWNLDPAALEAARTPRTKAIIPVHLYGHPADMAPIMSWADEHGITVIEDAAEAHGARYRGQRVGSFGAINVFSFYGNKIVTTGEGGMMTTNDARLCANLRKLRDHGMSTTRKYWHDVLGYNYRMTNVQAAIGVAQMEKVDKLLASKLEVAKRYRTALSGVPGVGLPPSMPWADSVYWLYSVIVDEEKYGCDRDTLMARLREVNIETRPLFPCVHQQPIYARTQTLPVAERLSRSGVSLPSAANMRLDDVDRVTAAIVQLSHEFAERRVAVDQARR